MRTLLIGVAVPARTQFFDLGRKLADSAVENLRKSTLSTIYRKYRGTMNEALAKMPKEIWPVKGLV